MATYLIDIDGTCADLTHRLRYIDGTVGKKDWDAFFAAAAEDRPIIHMRELLDALNSEDDLGYRVAQIIYVSGRPERIRDVTIGWLAEHRFPEVTKWDGAPRLYMRKDGDLRDDSIVKKELLDQIIADGHEPSMAFDDRDRVVKMWRENGIPCAQVAEGDF